jgi:hypothetical protein
MSKIEVNQISSQCGSTLTIGQSGDTVTLAAGATAAGFGSTGEVSWDTTKKTTGFTAVSGVGYFCDTTSASFTVTLPATPSSGNVVAVSDYNGTAATNAITVGRNGSNINGSANDFIISKSNASVQLIYVDATVGWQSVFTGNPTNAENPFIVATGGTITTCGNYKIHTFTGPGTFTVSNAGTPSGSNTVDYLVAAGGGGGGGRGTSAGGASGGGAGGYRESSGAASGCYTRSPLGACVSALPVTATAYPITVGAGGTGGPAGNNNGAAGNNSIFSSITSAGGGGGRHGPCGSQDGAPGGSGSGASGGVPGCKVGGAGNTPPVSPSQGNPGGSSVAFPANNFSSAGGGGAGGAGFGTFPAPRAGGPGVSTSISGSSTPYASGGDGALYSPPDSNGIDQAANSGKGAPGASGSGPGTAGGSGGSGVVIIRYKYQ